MPPDHRSDPGAGAGPARYPGTFRVAFQEALTELGWRVRRWRGDAVDCLDKHGREHMVGLENLFRRARLVDRSQWPALVGEFLAAAVAAEEGENLPTELAAAADRLLPRVGPPLKLPAADSRVWFQPLEGTDLGITLVVDHPNRMCYVTDKLVADSGRPGADWAERALANLRARTPPECFELVDEESDLLMCAMGDAYDSSRALLLEGLLPDRSTWGWLIALPGRDLLLAQPVTTKALPRLHLLKLLAEKDYKTVPYPISDEIYWVHQGVWRSFPIAIGPKAATVTPPPEFLQVLEALSPPEELPRSEETGSH